jgi:hypothetical protein
MDEPIRVRLPSDAPPEPPSATDAAEAFAGYLDELERLCNAATPGPWTSHQGSIWSASSRNPICDIDAGSPDEYDPDACFIEAARHALPKMIATVRELQSQLENAVALREYADKRCWILTERMTGRVCAGCNSTRAGTHCCDCNRELSEDEKGMCQHV